MWALICLILVHKGYSIATDSFDVTLVFEDSKFNQAHKVVLATSSALRTHPSSDKFVGFHEENFCIRWLPGLILGITCSIQ